MFRSVWKDPNNVETLREMWLANTPTRLIAAKIGGISRKAVIGKAMRLQLPTHAHAGGNNPKRQPVLSALVTVLRELDECLDFANGWPVCRCFPAETTCFGSTEDINKAFDAARDVLNRVKDRADVE